MEAAHVKQPIEGPLDRAFGLVQPGNVPDHDLPGRDPGSLEPLPGPCCGDARDIHPYHVVTQPSEVDEIGATAAAELKHARWPPRRKSFSQPLDLGWHQAGVPRRKPGEIGQFPEEAAHRSAPQGAR